jgi:hypothetical protein
MLDNDIVWLEFVEHPKDLEIQSSILLAPLSGSQYRYRYS